MECLDTIKSLKINFKKNISTVLIVVEGARDEFQLFKHIFRDVLHYEYVEKKRGQTRFREFNEFIQKGNENSRIIVVNTSNSNIGSIKEEKYRDDLYILLYEKYGLDIKNVPVYYIWDRDCDSNDEDCTKSLLVKMQNPYENDDYMSGLLLLSYPCSEAYTISCFDKNKEFLDVKPKVFVKDKGLAISDIEKNNLLKATCAYA